MSWSAGTATSYLDAIDDLKTLAEANGWTTDRYTTSGEYEWIATGNGAGSDVITCGIRSFSDYSRDYYNWELAGMDSYVGASAWSAQPGISEGRYDGSGTDIYGSYVLLANRSMKYWFSATSRRLCGVIRVGNVYQSFYMGWANPHDTGGNYADPKIIAGSCYDPTLRYSDSDVRNTGVANPIGSATSGREGPMQRHKRDGTWTTVKNRVSTDSQNIASSLFSSAEVVWPLGRIAHTTEAVNEDSWISNVSAGSAFALVNDMVVPGQTTSTDWPGNKRAVIRRVPNGGSDDAVQYRPLVVHDIDQSHVDLDGMFWCSAAAGPNDPGLFPEDDFDDGGTTFHCFPMGCHCEEWNWIAVEEK